MAAADSLTRVWSDVTGTQAAPSEAAILATAALALLLVLLPGPWGYARHFVTMAHEGAHGLVAVLTGRKPGGIKLHTDTSGVATSRGRPRGLGIVLTTAAGYPGPALLGLGAALLLAAGHALAVLWVGVALLVLMLLQMRNAWGLLTVLVAGAGVFAVSWWASGSVQSLFAYTATWFLLIAAPRPVFELQSRRRNGGSPRSDADALARLTPLPAIIWVGVFLAITLGALLLGARALWPA